MCGVIYCKYHKGRVVDIKKKKQKEQQCPANQYVKSMGNEY